MKGSKKPLLTLDASIVQDDVPLQVVPKIFVGSIHAAFNLVRIVPRPFETLLTYLFSRMNCKINA